MQEKYILELNNEQLHPKSKKLLTSLQNHWNGLTVFVDNPTIPMEYAKKSWRLLSGASSDRKKFSTCGIVP